MKIFLISLSVLLLFSTYINAQEQVSDTTQVQKIDEVVVTAQFQPQSEKNAIYKVKVFNSKQILYKASNNLRELLLQELNLDLAQNSVFGSSIEIQGISKENIKILIDGIPVIGRLNGVIDMTQINLSNIERVEVIEGPVSVFYGTDAMGGIINLITKKQQSKTTEGSISTYYESVDALSLDGDIGYKFGKNTIRLNSGYYHFGGLSTIETPRNLNWEEKTQFYGNVMFNRSLKKLNLRFNSRFSNEKLFSIGEENRNGQIEDINYFTRRIDNTLNLQGEVLNNKFIDITASYLNYQRYHDTYDVNSIDFEAVLSNTDTKENNLVKYNYAGIKAQIGKSNKNHKFNYAIGTDINTESTEGERIFENKQTILTSVLYSSLNFKLSNKFEIQPATRYTYNNVYGSLISPALNAKIRFDNYNQLRFSYARGFRAPSLKELYLDFHISVGSFTYIINGNKNLEVEKSHSFNLQYTFTTNSNSKIFSIEPSFFYNDISNLIALSELVNFKRNYINIENFKSIGGKIDFSYKPLNELTLKSGVSVIGRYNQFNEAYNSEKFIYSPEIFTNINYEILKNKTIFHAYYKFSGERIGFYFDENTQSLIKTTRGSFNNLDFTISKSFLKNNLQTSLGVKNVFNVKDIETINNMGEAHSRDMQLWGRSIFIKTTFKF